MPHYSDLFHGHVLVNCPVCSTDTDEFPLAFLRIAQLPDYPPRLSEVLGRPPHTLGPGSAIAPGPDDRVSLSCRECGRTFGPYTARGLDKRRAQGKALTVR